VKGVALPDSFDDLGKLWQDQQERIVIGSMPDFESFQSWMFDQVDSNGKKYEYSFEAIRGGSVRLTAQTNAIVSVMHEARHQIAGPHSETYYFRADTTDLGVFDPAAPRILVLDGEWFPYLIPFLTERLGGGFSRHWNRWEHHFTGRAGEHLSCVYRFNECYALSAARRLLLLPDRRDVDIVVTGTEAALEAAASPIADLAVRCRTEAAAFGFKIEVEMQPHEDRLIGAVNAAMSYLPREPRPRPSYWRPAQKADAATEADIQDIEQKLGVRLPHIVGSLLRQHNGGYLLGSNSVNQHGNVLRPNAGAFGSPWFYDAEMPPYAWKPTRPLSKLVAFTGDGHADICLDYRRRGSQHEPEITVIDTERAEERTVANSYAEYLGSLASSELVIAAASGYTPDDLADHLDKTLDGINFDLHNGRWVLTAGNRTQAVISGDIDLIPQYDDCETVIRFQDTDYVAPICASLAAAGMLEGSLPPQRWCLDL